MKLVERAIQTAGLNLNPQALENNIIRVPIPKMSGEYRETLAKQVAQMAEHTKQRVRTQRQDARTALKKIQKAISKDDFHRTDNEV